MSYPIHPSVKAVLATNENQFEDARILVRQYIESLPFDVSFQNYEKDIQNLDKVYTAPKGAFWMLEQDGSFVACSGIRYLEPGICELKRTYVMPEARSQGLGQLLVSKCLESAKALGYEKIYLDTHLSMTPAISLYEKNGFKDIHAYCYNPMEATRYLGRDL